MNYDVLKKSGVNTEQGLERCMDDAEFFEDMLLLFLKDDTFSRAKTALEAKDYDLLFKCMHELKGASGNAALVTLFDATCPLVELLRHSKGTDEQISELFSHISKVYKETMDGIRTAAGQ